MQITYKKDVKMIQVNGENIVDLTAVENGATAIFHSRVSEKTSCFVTTFRFTENECCPFCFTIASLTPVALIKTIVENKLNMQGLKYSNDDIKKIYNIIRDQKITDIFN